MNDIIRIFTKIYSLLKELIQTYVQRI